MLERDATAEPINLSGTHTVLNSTGDVERIARGKKFSDIPRLMQDRISSLWLLSEIDYEADWDHWKQHPAGDEIIYLLSGSIDIILDLDKHAKTIELRTNGNLTIPRGVWYTLKIHKPCKLLTISREFNTKTRKDRLVAGL